MPEIKGLPRWVWDLLADLLRHEDVHGYTEQCLTGALERVPADVRMVAEIIAEYRVLDAEIVEHHKPQETS
jgi:hypothetical protein